MRRYFISLHHACVQTPTEEINTPMQCLPPCLNPLCWHVCTTEPWSAHHLSVDYSPHFTAHTHTHTHTHTHSTASVIHITKHPRHKYYVTWLTVELTEALQSLCMHLFSHHYFTTAVFSAIEMKKKGSSAGKTWWAQQASRQTDRERSGGDSELGWQTGTQAQTSVLFIFYTLHLVATPVIFTLEFKSIIN